LRLDAGNKSTVNQPPDEWRVAIFAAPSTPVRGGTMFVLCAFSGKCLFPPAQKGSCDMRRIGSLLRAAPSRIGRRLALIVAIAAASLPSAGA